MSAQELVALYRMTDRKCPICQRIVSRYEKSLKICAADMDHLESCILKFQA